MNSNKKRVPIMNAYATKNILRLKHKYQLGQKTDNFFVAKLNIMNHDLLLANLTKYKNIHDVKLLDYLNITNRFLVIIEPKGVYLFELINSTSKSTNYAYHHGYELTNNYIYIPIKYINRLKSSNTIANNKFLISSNYFSVNCFQNLIFDLVKNKKFRYQKANVNNLDKLVKNFDKKIQKPKNIKSPVAKEINNYRQDHSFSDQPNTNMVSVSVFHFNKPTVHRESIAQRTKKSRYQIQHPKKPIMPQCILSFEKDCLLFMSKDGKHIDGSMIPYHDINKLVIASSKEPRLAIFTDDNLTLININKAINALIPSDLQAKNINKIKNHQLKKYKSMSLLRYYFYTHHIINKWVRINKHHKH